MITVQLLHLHVISWRLLQVGGIGDDGGDVLCHRLRRDGVNQRLEPATLDDAHDDAHEVACSDVR